MAGERMYRQIAADLREKIESAEFPPGGRLPAEIELMERYNASRNTVRDAIRLLATRGLVETRPGQGSFAVERISPFVTTLTSDPHVGQDGPVYLADVAASARQASISPTRVAVQPADAELAQALRVQPGSQVISRHQRRFIDGTPWSLRTAYYPMRLLSHGATQLLLAADLPQGTGRYLADECGIKQVGYRDSITVRPPDPGETSFFRLPPGSGVQMFVIVRAGFAEGGECFRLTFTVYPADRNRFLVDVGEVPPPGQPRPA